MADHTSSKAQARASLLLSALTLALAACGGAPTMATQTPPTPPAAPQASAPTTGTSTGTWVHTQWWESGLTTVVVLDAGGTAVCNGAIVGQRYAVSLASCNGAALVHFRYDHSGVPVPARRTESGAIAIYELDRNQDQVWPHRLPTTSPPAGEELRAIAFPYPVVSEVDVSAQACHVQSPSNGALRTDCVSPGALPGAPIFNWNGDLVGLMSGDGGVIGAAEIRSNLAAHGVQVD